MHGGSQRPHSRVPTMSGTQPAAMASNVFFAARSVLSSQVLRSTPAGASAIYWLLCCLATAMLLPAFLAFGEPSQLLAPHRLPLVGLL